MKRLRLAWWHWILIIIFVLIAFTYGGLAAIRLSGMSQYHDTVQELTDQGKIKLVDAYIDALPPVNSALQAAWEDWGNNAPDYPAPLNMDTNENRSLFLSRDKKIISELQTQVDSLRAVMSDGVSLVTNPALVLSANGHLASLAKGKRDLFALSYMPHNFLGSRTLMNWLHDDALLSLNPHVSLIAQDRLIKAMRPPAFLIDAMMLIANSIIRDKTYLNCCLLGSLSDEDRNRWLAEPSFLLHQLAETFKSECLFIARFVDYYAQQSFTGFVFGNAMKEIYGPTSSPSSVDPTIWPTTAWVWATIPHGSANAITANVALSDRLKGLSTENYASLQNRFQSNGALGLFSANIIETCHTALEADAHHRLFRLTVILIEHARKYELPTSQADLSVLNDINKFIIPPGDHLHLAYEYLGPRRFRVCVSPTSPVPNIEDTSRMAIRTEQYGKPPGTLPLIINRTAIEVEVPEITP